MAGAPAAPGGAGAPGRGLAVLALLFNAFSFGVSWWPLRQIGALGLHPLWLTGISFAVAAALLLLWRPAALLELWRTPSLWALMLGAGLTNASFNWAVSFGDVVRVVLLFYLMPLWAVLLARLLLGERISTRGALRVALALAGAGVVLWPVGAGSLPLPRDLAEGLAVLGGASFALNNVLLRREAQRSESSRALAMFLGGAVVALLLAGLLTQRGLAVPPPAPGWAWLAATAGMALWFLAANLALQHGAAQLPAHTTAVVLITEVLFASVSAVALGAGVIGPREALGAVMIISASLLAAVQRD